MTEPCPINGCALRPDPLQTIGDLGHPAGRKPAVTGGRLIANRKPHLERDRQKVVPVVVAHGARSAPKSVSKRRSGRSAPVT